MPTTHRCPTVCLLQSSLAHQQPAALTQPIFCGRQLLSKLAETRPSVQCQCSLGACEGGGVVGGWVGGWEVGMGVGGAG